MKLVTGHDNGGSRRSGSGSGRGSGGSGSGSSSGAGGVRLVTSVRHRHPPHSSSRSRLAQTSNITKPSRGVPERGLQTHVLLRTSSLAKDASQAPGESCQEVTVR